ncbi:protein nullo [Drosophila serrata]|uniref:protein nullo n=1 Tax=Drosophila serrata TaxID=7274 RepID=UPI000A1D0B08|nr:protein nullo [Drosophila serrata]
MGSTHSTEEVKAGEDTTSPAPPGLCCPLPGFLAKIQRILLRKLNISARKQKRLRRLTHSQSRHLLRPMPRCSSFGSCGNLLTPPTTKRSGGLPADKQYAQWKCSFEHLAAKQGKQRLHDISEAFVGQTTPRGFPSHTDTKRCRKTLLSEKEKQPEEDQLALPESPLYDMVGGGMKVRRRLSLKSGNSHTLGRRPSARQKAAQARLEAQFKRDLCDLEEYYGGFHFARHSERLAKF